MKKYFLMYRYLKGISFWSSWTKCYVLYKSSKIEKKGKDDIYLNLVNLLIGILKLIKI